MKNGTFCNMCFKAGKPASDYNSHSVKVKGKVVCPYLLSIECRYCHEKGHTPSGCPVLKRKKRAANEALKKYDVTGLPPMPTVLRPLVMPTSKLAPVPATVRPLVMPTTKPNALEGVTMTKRKFINEKRMSWADMCDTDEEDDEF
jgi:hypothetical protein